MIYKIVGPKIFQKAYQKYVTVPSSENLLPSSCEGDFEISVPVILQSRTITTRHSHHFPASQTKVTLYSTPILKQFSTTKVTEHKITLIT